MEHLYSSYAIAELLMNALIDLRISDLGFGGLRFRV